MISIYGNHNFESGFGINIKTTPTKFFEFLSKYKEFGDVLSDAGAKISVVSNEKACRANIMTDIQTGEYNETSGKSGQAVQAVLDIDIYKDSFEKSDSLVNYILGIYDLLNRESYKIYKSALTDEFYAALLNGTVNDTDILGGVFDVQNCD